MASTRTHTHTRTTRSCARTQRLSLSLACSLFSPDAPNLPNGPPRPREVETSSLSEGQKSRARGLAADAPPLASLHYTVKSNETRHLIPPRNVLSDCPQLEHASAPPAGSRARETIRIARLSKKKNSAYSTTLTVRDRRCARGRRPHVGAESRSLAFSLRDDHAE